MWEKGILLSLALIVVSLIFHFTSVEVTTKFQWVGYVVFVAGIIIFTVMYGKQQNGQATFGNLFAHGFKISAIVTLIMILWIVLSFKLIFPDSEEKIFQAIRTAALKKGSNEQEISQAMEITKKYLLTFLIGGMILYYAILGVIGSLLGAAFSKKAPAGGSPFQQ